MTNGSVPFRHFFITRYSLCNADSDWHARRLELFRRIYLPSLESQDCREFYCLLLADHGFPDAPRLRLGELLPDDRYRLVPVQARGPTSFDHRDVLAPLLELSEDAPFIITTRMDSDDAIASDFVSRLQACFQEQPFEVINFRRGFVWQAGRIGLADCPSNMFLSMISARRSLVHCYARPHRKMQDDYPTRELTGTPAWLHLQHASAFSTQNGSRLTPLQSSRPDTLLPATFFVDLKGL